MSITGGRVLKHPLKLIEVPLRKFDEEVIPHHQQLYEQHKSVLFKLISSNNVEQIRREVRDKKRVVRQLRELMYELDTLRVQVEDTDLDVFDTKTLSLRKIILKLITNYTDLENKAFTFVHNQEVEEGSKENQDPFSGVAQIQLQESLDQVKLKQRQEVLNRVEDIHRDVEDLHQVYTQLNEMVGVQGEHVDHVEETVESASYNVHAGLKQLVKAHKLKTAAYPVTGAFLGGIIGGPIGLVAGFKVGGLAALGCAIAGYTGGHFCQKAQEPAEEVQNSQNVDATPVSDDPVEKKDI